MGEDVESTQLVVIGAGPGGYAAAFLAADLGMQVTLVDKEKNPGGVCLYRGCIPSKALLHVAKVITEAEAAKEWGVEFGKPKIDVAKIQAWKDLVVGRLTGGLGQINKQRKVNYVQGEASFQDAKSLKIVSADGEASSLFFETAILATGSSPNILSGFDIDSPHLLDSTSALELSEVPGNLLVIGGGYIGLELGTVYATLGSKVSVVEMLPGLLPGADRDLVRYLSKRVSELFENVMLETTVTSLTAQKNGIKVEFQGKKAPSDPQIFDKVLVSIGRKPNSSGLGLENTSVVVDDRGFVQVDARRQTNEPSIFAIGDVVGEPMLAHKASHEGRTAVEAIAGHKVSFEPAAIPAVVFTDPELAWCGLTETDAKERGIDVEIAGFPWAASGRAMTLGRGDGLTKLVIDPGSRQVLGVGIVGPGAGELIAEGVLAIEMAALVDDLKLTIHPHPTLTETLMEAAEVFFGQSTHIYRPRRSR